MLNRPELEKDNPMAPQIYVGPRRKRALARKASIESLATAAEITSRLQRLVDAAERFVHSLPPMQETDKERTALLEAISYAQGCLTIEDSPASNPKWISNRR
mgnify:CR=1 FL=1